MAYPDFKKINGTHPWRDASPHGFIDYSVRYRPGGKVIYFNFSLARELGLIPQDHPPRMNRPLEKTILQTFSLQIINEYDQLRSGKNLSAQIRPQLFMATRYLQSQHKNRQGKTSGDGRSIWNGFIKTKDMTFDITSRGTGATALSPGVRSRT